MQAKHQPRGDVMVNETMPRSTYTHTHQTGVDMAGFMRLVDVALLRMSVMSQSLLAVWLSRPKTRRELKPED